MAQHRGADSSGQDSAVCSHLKESSHSFEDSNVHILDREDRWFERGVKEAIYVEVEKTIPQQRRRSATPPVSNSNDANNCRYNNIEHYLSHVSEH